MNELSNEKKSLQKIVWLDFIFAIVGLIIALFILTPDTISSFIMERTGQSTYTKDIEFYLPLLTRLLTRPFLIIYSIHRLYTGIKNYLLLKS